MKGTTEIEGYIIQYKTAQEAKITDKNGKEYTIIFAEYRRKIKCSDYKTRYSYETALVDLLPKELPYKVREFLIFQY